MDWDKRSHHRSNSNNNNSSTTKTTSEIFICFTSRLSSSSSMKMSSSSRSILSPGRCSNEPSQITMSTSLSRRLRSIGSMKGGQASPMFSSASNNGRKRSCSYENPEPSSPKVTCIGQVRVKTKKHSRKITGSRSQRRASRGGEISFRSDNNGETHQDFGNANSQFQQQEDLHHRNQRWVQLPSTICEALRSFGAELNCFLPCRSSCMVSEKDKQENDTAGNGSNHGSTCGAVFARWLLAMQENSDDIGKRRGIELVVNEEEEEEEEEDFTERRRSYRRPVFEDIDFNDEKYGVGNYENSLQDEDSARVGICIPPKNALLLMRCRSDPVKMAALGNKFWEPVSIGDNGEIEEDEDNDDGNDQYEEEEKKGKGNNIVEVDQEMEEIDGTMDEMFVSCQTHETEVILEEEEDGEDDNREERTDIDDGEVEEEQVEILQETVMGSHDQENEDPDRLEIEYEEKMLQENGIENARDDIQELKSEEEKDNLEIEESEAEEKETTEETCIQEQEQGQETVTTHEGPECRSESENPKTQEEEMVMESKERESQTLPDCLLLMMCEPKLSMEVSKETWVCSTDFIRWLPDHSRAPKVNKKDGGHQPKKRISIDSNNPPSVQGNLQQPPRSSCSYPAKPPDREAGTESMATAIEKKLVGTNAYEPFVLTRCKSEPMRSAAKLAPEACFWKNRKLEQHPPATVGVGAAGVGF